MAVVWSLAFAWAARLRLPVWYPVLQALVAWAVYVGDRLLDARAAFGTGRTAHLRTRHHFHWRHRRILLPLAGAAACIALGIILVRIPPRAREEDTVLGTAALAYFSGVHSLERWGRFRLPFPSKESLVGVLFSAGCVLPTITFAEPSERLLLLLAAIVFAALAWLNCRAIERWENPPTRFRVFDAACMAGVTDLCLGVTLFFAQPRFGVLLLAAATSNLLLGVLDRLQTRLTPLTLRAAADLVLLTPLVVLFR